MIVVVAVGLIGALSLTTNTSLNGCIHIFPECWKNKSWYLVSLLLVLILHQICFFCYRYLCKLVSSLPPNSFCTMKAENSRSKNEQALQSRSDSINGKGMISVPTPNVLFWRLVYHRQNVQTDRETARRIQHLEKHNLIYHIS